jgi:beta-lactamase regulating signal transducer with metallopeptidase domain
MNMPLWFSNLTFWSVQVALLVLAVGFLPRLLQIRQPRVLLIYWRTLVAITLLLPLLQPWHHTQNTGTITFAPEITNTAIPASSPTVAHWHFPSVQIIPQMIGVVILVGIAARLLILALGFLKLRQFRRTSSPISTLSESGRVLEEMRSQVSTRAEFRLSAGVHSPVTFGFAAPVILLPERFPSMDARFQTAIACHELLHVRRHDWAHHLTEEILRAALWFHPAIAWLIGRVRLAREQVVDLEVVALTDARKIYLEALLEFTPSRARTAPIPAPPFLVEREFAERVALMLKEVRMSRARLIASLTAIACWLALAATLAVWTFPLKGAPRATQNRPQSQQTERASSKFVVADLRIDGDVKDADAVRSRILKGLEGREFESNRQSLDEIGENIRADFQDHGYFKVLSDIVGVQWLDPEKRRMLIIAHIDEGEQYRTGDISIVSDDPARALVIPEEELRQRFQLHTGDLFNAGQVRNGFAGIRQLYFDQGYLDVTAEPKFSLDQKNQSIATTIHVHEGNQYHVGRFEVRGLDSKTKELLEARMQPGSPFNGTLLKDLFNQGKATLGANVAFDSFNEVVGVKRNVQAGTADVVFSFLSAPRTN